MKKPLEIGVSPLQEIQYGASKAKGLRLYMKRDDLLHPILSGNKWRKLCYNLSAAKVVGKGTLLSFGGAYSNHIHALSAAGELLGFRTIGIIRGEEPAVYGATLRFACDAGMRFRFLSRSAYRKKEIPADIDLEDVYVLPEGGSNYLAIKGCREIVEEVATQLEDAPADYYCLAVGTGGTTTGVIDGLAGRGQGLGFSVLKGSFLHRDIQFFQKEYQLQQYSNWRVVNDYHFGGYARFQMTLIDFIKRFFEETGICLDPVYTGKMVYGVFDLIAKDYFPKGSRIVLIHTGGLQGVAGFEERYGIGIFDS